MARAGWKRLVVAGMWSRRRIVGETVLALLLALSATLGVLDDGPAATVAVALAAAAMSLLRRAFPASVLVLTGALAAELPGFWALLTVAGWSAGPRIKAPRWALAAFTLSYVLNAAVSVLQTESSLPAAQTLLFTTLSFLATTVVPGLAARYRAQRRTLMHALHEHNAQLLREREIIASHARLRERQRIAQDMHDSLGHQLALIAVHTGALEVDRKLTDGQREAVGVLRDASVAAMHELREAVGILRDGTHAQEHESEAAPATRGVAGIDGLVEASRGAGADVELRRAGEERSLAPAADHAAYRIVQEALTNALKHAPGAPIVVELRYEPDSLVVEVANGPVPAAADGGRRLVVSGGQGLTGLQERARLVGGMVHAGPAAGGGFRVAGVLPYGSAERAGSAPQVTTFVEAANDFRGQSEGVRPGDGGAVIDWSGPPEKQKELDLAMGSKKKGIAIGCGAALVIIVGLGVLAVWGIAKLWDESDKAMIEPSVYKSVKVGDTETVVRGKLPDGKSFLTDGLHDKGPAKPKGADCLVLLSTEIPDNLDDEPLFRFCFKDGKLIEKQSYTVKS
ncbi:histidine kinase [Streptomyces sp. DG2A-72]|uniref:sensor histidine kinase n=1 Tax=Streptomyces sp. DG2A-72 TaxID=3051386 RepID=UPI00265C5093|nr:histidine kinase [Streptomyces sp. DG2A-72]MDO0935261.1 histidine kinase [Streptomyces sp. DG2A-72]